MKRPADGAEPEPVVEPAPATPESTSTTPESAPDAPESAPNMPERALTDRERAILAFEKQWWKRAGAKEQAIRETFDISVTRYYQLLNALLDNPAALAAEPALVSRLRRLRSARSRARRR